MAIQSFAEFFGCDDYDVFRKAQNAQDTAEGYIAGTQVADRVRNELIVEFKNRSRAYKEAVLNAIREQI